MKKRQAGFTLLEVVGALTVMGIVLAMASKLTDQYMTDAANQVAASHAKQFIDASQKYIKDNYAAVVASATSTVPTTITAAQLVAGNYLPTGFSETNSFGQTISTYALEPVANQITAVVVTTGGTAVNDLDLGVVAASIGEKGGAVRSSAATTLTGAFGKWAIPLASYGVAPGAGHFGGAIWFDQGGNVVADYLYRSAVPGHPEANRMNTTLDLGGNRITALKSIATIGSACGAGVAAGDVAIGPAGEVVSCQGGVWKSQGSAYWQDPVAAFANLPACNAAAIGQTRVVRTPTIGTGARAYTCDGAGNWQALGLDNSGNLTLPGALYTNGAGSTYGGVTLQGSKNGWSGINFKDSTGANSGTLMMHPSYSGFYNAADNAWRWYVDNTGNSIQSGNMTAGTATLTTVVTEGDGCSPNGKVARDAAGLLLSCQSGVWRKASGTPAAPTLPSGSLCGFKMNGGLTFNCMGVSPLICPAGYTPRSSSTPAGVTLTTCVAN